MTRYRWDGDHFVDRDGIPMPVPERDYVPSPYIQSDISYISPLTRKPVTSRSQRREEMKVHNVREVDPSEHKVVWSDERTARANRGEWEKPKLPDLGGGYERQPVDRKRLAR